MRYLVHLIFLGLVHCEEFNLMGEAGQAYSIETYFGRPIQKLNLIVDTGSTTMAVAAYSRRANDKYYDKDFSQSSIVSHQNLEAKYSQGMWVGTLVSDKISFPSLQNIPEVRCDFAAIISSDKFFMNGSGWQGLLGLAYPPIAAWGSVEVEDGSWLQSVDRIMKSEVSFELELCGPVSDTNSTHYGKFSVIVNSKQTKKSPQFRTPILHRRWYEIGVLGINVNYVDLSDSTNCTRKQETDTCIQYDPPRTDDCIKLNSEKSIVDSGTTSIRLPDDIFKQVVGYIRGAALCSNVSISDDFWFQGEAACWKEPQEWDLPWVSIDLLNADDDKSYFILHVPPQNYIRMVTARNNNESQTEQEYCYKLGLEPGGKDTVLGYTAMEGLQVLFNRSDDWIGFSASTCGPNTHLSGPYYVSYSLVTNCDLLKPRVDPSIRAAQWSLLAVSMLAVGILVYVLAPFIKYMFFNPNCRRRSISRTALFESEFT